MKDNVARNLIALRGNMSRDEVARSIGISVSALAMYESAQRSPRDEIKVKLANFYNRSVQDIFFNKQLHDTCSNEKAI